MSTRSGNVYEASQSLRALVKAVTSSAETAYARSMQSSALFASEAIAEAKIVLLCMRRVESHFTLHVQFQHVNNIKHMICNKHKQATSYYSAAAPLLPWPTPGEVQGLGACLPTVRLLARVWLPSYCLGQRQASTMGRARRHCTGVRCGDPHIALASTGRAPWGVPGDTALAPSVMTPILPWPAPGEHHGVPSTYAVYLTALGYTVFVIGSLAFDSPRTSRRFRRTAT
jgi:hypothetical protein